MALDEHSTWLSVFQAELKQLTDNNLRLYYEFGINEKTQAFQSSYSFQSHNCGKNRYDDVRPSDDRRVVLQCVKKTEDYINASYVSFTPTIIVLPTPRDGKAESTAERFSFIMAQGPKPNTVGDFWRMIWQQNTTSIIMVTSLEESNRQKCFKYWPDNKLVLPKLQSKSSSDHSLTIEMTSHRYIDNLVDVREFRVTSSEAGGDGEKERVVTQYQFTAWRDHSTPNMEHFVEFIFYLIHEGVFSSCRSASFDGCGLPVIHCSAGVGRSGVVALTCGFVLQMASDFNLDLDNQSSSSPSSFDPIDYVTLPHITSSILQMRRSRPMVVQTASQFGFACQAIADSAIILMKNGFVQAAQRIASKMKGSDDAQNNHLSGVEPSTKTKDAEEEVNSIVRKRKHSGTEPNQTESPQDHNFQSNDEAAALLKERKLQKQIRNQEMSDKLKKMKEKQEASELWRKSWWGRTERFIRHAICRLNNLVCHVAWSWFGINLTGGPFTSIIVVAIASLSLGFALFSLVRRSNDAGSSNEL